MRYYSTKGPLSIGSFPLTDAVSIHNFDGIQYVPAIESNAWGYVDYKKSLPMKIAKRYGLILSFSPKDEDLFVKSAEAALNHEHIEHGWYGFKCPCCAGQAEARRKQFDGSIVARCSVCGVKIQVKALFDGKP